MEGSYCETKTGEACECNLFCLIRKGHYEYECTCILRFNFEPMEECYLDR